MSTLAAGAQSNVFSWGSIILVALQTVIEIGWILLFVVLLPTRGVLRWNERLKLTCSSSCPERGFCFINKLFVFYFFVFHVWDFSFSSQTFLCRHFFGVYTLTSWVLFNITPVSRILIFGSIPTFDRMCLIF